MTVLSLLCCAVLLTGCNQTVNASKGLTQIRDWPEKPQGQYTQRDVAEYIVKGKSAYESCSATVNVLGAK
jgi:hypothetical protein